MTVYIIGAGCGDSELLTGRASSMAEKCKVIIGPERLVKKTEGFRSPKNLEHLFNNYEVLLKFSLSDELSPSSESSLSGISSGSSSSSPFIFFEFSSSSLTIR